MNINPSRYLRAVSNFFFIFTLFFGPGTTQASVFQGMSRGFSNVSQFPKMKKVFDILKDLGINPEDLSTDKVRTLVRVLDDPTHLIKPSSEGFFESDLYRVFFFSRFDLHRDSDALFTKLFAKKSGNEELPFKEAKRNWEDFLDAIKSVKQAGGNQIEETDLEAAAISFIHKRFSYKYSSNINDLDPFSTLTYLSSWEEQSLGMFFHRRFTIGHYINPHYTLNMGDSYHQFIMKIIFLHYVDFRSAWNSRRFAFWEHLAVNPQFTISINSKKFILKIWSDLIEEIKVAQMISTPASFSFLTLITSSVFECRKLQWKPGVSIPIESHPFLNAMVEASRENDGLAKVVDIIKNLAFQPGTDQEIEEQLAIEIGNIFIN